MSRRCQRALDWFTLFVADVQTGFGPFISVYLTAHQWTQVDIGLVLTAGGLAALAFQMPGGLILDAVRSERRVAAFAMIGISVSALVLALWPIFPAVLGAQILHAAASCVLNPAIAAISLELVGHAAVGEQFGRNARFASIGSGLAAAGMGATGYFLSNQAVFLVTALLTVPTLIALAHIPASQIDPVRAHGGLARGRTATTSAALRTLLTNRSLATFAVCVGIFQLANAAMLPLMASIITMRSSTWATTLVAACIVVPQLAVAAISPTVGRWAQRFGRRPILLLGFGAMPVRGLLFMVVTDPQLLVAVQLLDGNLRRGVRRPRSPDHRRYHARHRPLQPGARDRRDRNRYRRVAEYDAGRIDQRSPRQRRGVPGPGLHRRGRISAVLAADAGDRGAEGRSKAAPIRAEVTLVASNIPQVRINTPGMSGERHNKAS